MMSMNYVWTNVHACVCAHDMSQMGLYVNEENTLLRVIPFDLIVDMPRRRLFYVLHTLSYAAELTINDTRPEFLQRLMVSLLTSC